MAGAPPTVAAQLRDGPLSGKTIDVAVIEGRAPATIDVPDDEGMCRYVVGWGGHGKLRAIHLPLPGLTGHPVGLMAAWPYPQLPQSVT